MPTDAEVNLEELLDELETSLTDLPEVLRVAGWYDKLRYGDGGGVPYALRNFIPNIEGYDGGDWLGQRGDSFIENVRILKDLVNGEYGGDEDE